MGEMDAVSEGGGWKTVGRRDMGSICFMTLTFL
jgi:hypothetical protein